MQASLPTITLQLHAASDETLSAKRARVETVRAQARPQLITRLIEAGFHRVDAENQADWLMSKLPYPPGATAQEKEERLHKRAPALFADLLSHNLTRHQKDQALSRFGKADFTADFGPLFHQSIPPARDMHEYQGWVELRIDLLRKALRNPALVYRRYKDEVMVESNDLLRQNNEPPKSWSYYEKLMRIEQDRWQRELTALETLRKSMDETGLI